MEVGTRAEMPREFRLDILFQDEGPTLETLDHTIRIGSTPTFLYFDLYLYSGHCVYIYFKRLLGLFSDTTTERVDTTETSHDLIPPLELCIRTK